MEKLFIFRVFVITLQPSYFLFCALFLSIRQVSSMLLSKIFLQIQHYAYGGTMRHIIATNNKHRTKDVY